MDTQILYKLIDENKKQKQQILEIQQAVLEQNKTIEELKIEVKEYKIEQLKHNVENRNIGYNKYTT